MVYARVLALMVLWLFKLLAGLVLLHALLVTQPKLHAHLVALAIYMEHNA